MADEIKPLSPPAPSYTVGSQPDDDRREKDKKPLQNEDQPTDESEQQEQQNEDKGLFDDFA